MRGLELSEKYYNEYGLPMLENQFSDILPYIAIGLVGSGSECFGYDDEISTDHDFEPGFCIFLPEESVIDRRKEFLLERAYSKLPKEYMGFKRNVISPVGGNRHGVIRTEDFFLSKTGDKQGRLSINQWLTVPEYSLAEALNGKVFFDGYGQFSKIRNDLSYYPEDIMLKKLAGNMLLMGQAGQYNFKRCIMRNEFGAAQLAAFDFVKSALNVIFILNRKYMPYYKWSFRAFRDLQLLSDCEKQLVFLISEPNDNNIQKKELIIENICKSIIFELNSQFEISSIDNSAEEVAYKINNLINDSYIRNLHILSAV